MLALRDVRARILASVGDCPPYRESDLLAVDPLTVLRCMRLASAPILKAPLPIRDLGQLTEILGTASLQRALETPVSDPCNTEALRTLWLHALATAAAAELLAGERDTGIGPGEAYCHGLMHDLPLWLAELATIDEIRGDRAPRWRSSLKRQIVATIGATVATTVPEREPIPSLATLLREAEQWAVFAGFAHPRSTESEVELGRDDTAFCARISDRVRSRLARVGLDLDVRVPDPTVKSDGDLCLFQLQRTGPTLEMVMRLLGSSDGSRSRTVNAVTAAAAVRYLGFDRAHFLRWNLGHSWIMVRSKADLSSRRADSAMFQPNQAELAAMQRALAGQVEQLEDEGSSEGLLAMLGADEVILVVIHTEGENRSLLVLDRALSARPLALEEDTVGIQALAGTARILLENLRLRRLRERAERFALTDPLTRLAARNVGLAFLAQQLAARARKEQPVSVIMVDMDEFKKLNDSLGHLAGDEALRHSAHVIRRTLRKSDVVCRFGGEEFLVVLPDTDLDEAALLAARLAAAVQEAGEATRLPLSISLGIASASRVDETVESVLARADHALYASKATGRSRFSVDTGV